MAVPVELRVELETEKKRSVKIIKAKGGEVITVFEFLSPSNKTGGGLQELLQERRELLSAGVHIVEIDLVRAGDWRKVLHPYSCPRQSLSEYRAVVRPGKQRMVAYLYPMPLRKKLPTIPIPLRKEDPQVVLDLQQLVDDAFRHGRYRQTLNYQEPLDPPLAKDDQEWAAKLLRR